MCVCVCVCACVRACVRVCVRACVRVCVCVGGTMQLLLFMDTRVSLAVEPLSIKDGRFFFVM